MKSKYESLCAVLEEILQDADTKVFRNSIKVSDKAELQETFAGEDWLEMNLLDFSVHASRTALKKNQVFFEEIFKPFIDKSSGLMGVSSVLCDSTRNLNLSARDFIDCYVIRAAVFLGSERVSRLLVDWINGIPLKFILKYQLHGIRLNSPITVTDELKILPPDQEYFDSKLSSWSDCGLESGTGALLFGKGQTEAVFFKPSESFHDKILESNHKIRDFINCLSLVLQSHVSMNCWWLFNKDLQPFAPKSTITSFGTVQSNEHPVDLTLPKIIDALELVPNNIKLRKSSNRLVVGMERWSNSRSTAKEYNKFIEMRIALDALFTGKDERSNNDKQAINIAKFLGVDANDCENIYKMIRVFQREASIIIHGGEITGDLKTTIEEIQDIFVDAMVKILKEGHIPDWRTFPIQNA